MSSWAIWALIALGVAGLEMLSGDFFLLMLAGGAAAAAATGALGGELWLQLVVFAVVSLCLVAGVRPWARRMLTRNQPEIIDGIQAVIGSTGIVTQPVDTHGGRIKVGADEWSAMTQQPFETFAIGARVLIIDVQGAHAIVTESMLEI